jgi:hypothetical protein
MAWKGPIMIWDGFGKDFGRNRWEDEGEMREGLYICYFSFVYKNKRR